MELKTAIFYVLSAILVAASLRVIKDKKTAYASSSDLEMGTLRRLVRGAVRRAELGNPDEFAGLAPLSTERVDAAALDLYDPAIAGLTQAQELWLYAHIKRDERRKYNENYDLVKLMCSFINYAMAKEMFTEPEHTENVGFLDDLKKLDPNFNPAKYEDILSEE